MFIQRSMVDNFRESEFPFCLEAAGGGDVEAAAEHPEPPHLRRQRPTARAHALVPGAAPRNVKKPSSGEKFLWSWYPFLGGEKGNQKESPLLDFFLARGGPKMKYRTVFFGLNKENK